MHQHPFIMRSKSVLEASVRENCHCLKGICIG